MRSMTNNRDMYTRLIQCIVLNSFTSVFKSEDKLSSTIAEACLDAMSSKTTNLTGRIADFYALVKMYRDKILRDCEQYRADSTVSFKTPKEETEERAFAFFDAKRDEIIKTNKKGKLPKMVPLTTVRDAALSIHGIRINCESTDKCERYMYGVYRTVGTKWWQSRVTKDDNVRETHSPAGSSPAEITVSSQKFRRSGRLLRKRKYREEKEETAEVEEENDDEEKNEDSDVSSSDESTSDQDASNNNGKESPVFWVRSDKHFRFLMQLKQKEARKKQALQSI